MKPTKFVVSSFENRNGNTSWRVDGYFNGVRIRKNFKTREEAAAEQSVLELKALNAATDVAFLQGMSLRQAYARLGIATEPKTPGMRPLAHRLPAYVLLANKLVRVLKHQRGKTAEEQGEVYRRDLRALYETLRPWFESAPNKTW